MKLLLVTSSYLPNFGGLESVTSQLASELQLRGMNVSVLAQRYPRTLASAEEIQAVRTQRLFFFTPCLLDLQRGRLDLFLASLFYFPTTLMRLLWRIARDKPDVVNLHFVGAPALFLLIAHTLLRFRFVVSLHGDDVEGLPHRTWFDRWVFRATLRRADAVTACSHYLLSRAEDVEPVIARKARVIYNGTDLPDDAFASRTSILGSGVLGVGRLVPSKGWDVLLRAWSERQGAINHRCLSIIGDGPERDTLMSLSRALGLGQQVEFRGAQGHVDVMKEIGRSALVVIPSRQETFGLVALEAMASGKPVVATRVGGLPEVLEGADALLVEPDNPVALAEAITSMLARIEREPQFGAHNREVAARFSTARMAQQFIACYDCGV